MKQFKRLWRVEHAQRRATIIEARPLQRRCVSHVFLDLFHCRPQISLGYSIYILMLYSYHSSRFTSPQNMRCLVDNAIFFRHFSFCTNRNYAHFESASRKNDPMFIDIVPIKSIRALRITLLYNNTKCFTWNKIFAERKLSAKRSGTFHMKHYINNKEYPKLFIRLKCRYLQVLIKFHASKQRRNQRR